jgi:hypothetical protein
MLDRIPTPPPADVSPEGGGKRRAQIIEWIYKEIYILYSLGIGLFLLWIPWQGFWENNYWLYLYPQIRPVIANPFFKGFVLGLGIANIMIGIYEVARTIHVPKKNFLS